MCAYVRAWRTINTLIFYYDHTSKCLFIWNKLIIQYTTLLKEVLFKIKNKNKTFNSNKKENTFIKWTYLCTYILCTYVLCMYKQKWLYSV